jgi:hypothetical protein
MTPAEVIAAIDLYAADQCPDGRDKLARLLRLVAEQHCGDRPARGRAAPRRKKSSSGDLATQWKGEH